MQTLTGMVRLFFVLTAFFGAALVVEAQEAVLMASIAEVAPRRVKDTYHKEVPMRLSRKFKRDAARLALRIEAKREDLRYQNIIIPKANVESIYEVLTNIYSQNETAQSISKCNVHTFPNPSIDHLVIIFDRDIEWAEPLLDGVSETDSDEINDLLEEFDLIIDKHVQWDDVNDAITLRSKEPLNMAALANEFYNIEGVDAVDLGIPKIGGNDINIARIDGGWEVQYILRFGSYIAGKGKAHIWTYRAMDNGDVIFKEATGDPVPDWMRCHFAPAQQLAGGDMRRI